MNHLLLTISVFACVASNILGYPVHGSHDDKVSSTIDYSVKDFHTGDVKQHHEVRSKDFVLGTYSLADSDGTYRIVEYEAYPHKGFNAVVKRIGEAHHPQVYHNHEGPLHNEEHHHDIHDNEIGDHLGKAESYVGVTHWGFQNENHHNVHDNKIGEHYGEAESHAGVTHWGHQ